jgi:hypothetical protein
MVRTRRVYNSAIPSDRIKIEQDKSSGAHLSQSEI